MAHSRPTAGAGKWAAVHEAVAELGTDTAQVARNVDAELEEICETLARMAASSTHRQADRELSRLSAWLWSLRRNHCTARTDCDYCNTDGA